MIWRILVAVAVLVVLGFFCFCGGIVFWASNEKKKPAPKESPKRAKTPQKKEEQKEKAPKAKAAGKKQTTPKSSAKEFSDKE